jgi:hypothetical protein
MIEGLRLDDGAKTRAKNRNGDRIRKT